MSSFLKRRMVRKVEYYVQQDRADAVNEIRLLASVTHEHVVGYHEAFVDGNRLCIVMEYAPHGDLSRAIRYVQTFRFCGMLLCRIGFERLRRSSPQHLWGGYVKVHRHCKKRQAQQKYFSEDQIWSYLIQITIGLQALHAARILHRPPPVSGKPCPVALPMATWSGR
eukprot:8720094-Pyramimonas_sp.AAC.1